MPYKFRLIPLKPQDPGSLWRFLAGRAKKWLYIKLFSERLVIAFLLVAFFLVTASTGAGPSFFSGILGRGAQTSNVANEKYLLTDLSLLQAAQNFDPNPAKGGGDLTIIDESALLAETGPSGSMANIEDAPASDQISIYVVRQGDTLSQIASLFGVSANTIIWANNLTRGGALSVGQTLVILPVSGIQHTVVEGETVQSIAKKYGGDADEIISYNDLSANGALAVGHIVLIPDGEIAVAPKTSSSATSYAGYYIRPIVNAVKTQGLHGYNGVDLAGPYGEPIIAAASGQIIIARDSGWNGGYGKYVVISHANGTQTLYSHLSQVIVFVGQYVVQGQVIGYEGSTGKATGPHLHFEIRGAKNPF